MTSSPRCVSLLRCSKLALIAMSVFLCACHAMRTPQGDEQHKQNCINCAHQDEQRYIPLRTDLGERDEVLVLQGHRPIKIPPHLVFAFELTNEEKASLTDGWRLNDKFHIPPLVLFDLNADMHAAYDSGVVRVLRGPFHLGVSRGKDRLLLLTYDMHVLLEFEILQSRFVGTSWHGQQLRNTMTYHLYQPEAKYPFPVGFGELWLLHPPFMDKEHYLWEVRQQYFKDEHIVVSTEDYLLIERLLYHGVSQVFSVVDAVHSEADSKPKRNTEDEQETRNDP